ncbi:unnamed protein product [Gordionus sp. m RMFG-2023]
MVASYLIILFLTLLYYLPSGSADPQLVASQLRFDRYNQYIQQRDRVGSEIYCANKCSTIEGGICPLCPNITTTNNII